MAQVLALVDDLFFQMKLMETAKQVGVELLSCRTSEALAAEIKKQRPNLVVIDLNASGNPLAAIESVNRMRASGNGEASAKRGGAAGESSHGTDDYAGSEGNSVVAASNASAGLGEEGSSAGTKRGEGSNGMNEAGGRKITMIAFLSHVQVDLAAKARAAGCSDVMPRSKFTQNLATILAQAKSESA
jgi:CheY-like chemotaxis protein